MTLAEIYTTICSLVYGDPVASPPPAHEVARIQDEILMLHHKVQQDYNYWFMYYRTVLALVSGTYTYTLPTAYKELIRLDTDYEYEMMGTVIYFHNEDVTETEDVRFDYWKFLTTPAWSNIFTDNVTTYCHWIIIYSVVASLLLKREGIQMAQFYMAKAEDAAASAQNEDFFRRQDPKTTW